MRAKERKLIITFHTTAEAIAAEGYYKERQLPGRLIPVPREISAGCGLAWAAPLECKTLICENMIQDEIGWEAWQELVI